MKRFVLSLLMTFILILPLEAKLNLRPTKNSPESIFEKELHFLELKTKKEISDKKNSTLKKYTLAILAAREFRSLEDYKRANDFYKHANEMKIDIDKKEIKDFSKDKLHSNINIEAFYFDSNLKELIANKQYEKAILSINPNSFSYKENENLRIIYDLLQVKIKKLSVKKLYCIDSSNKELEGLNYESVLCEYLEDYLKLGKKDKSHLAYIEDYFFKNDLKERYLLSVLKDLN